MRALRPRTILLLGVVACAFTMYLFGVVRLGWEFEQMAALFLAMGIVAGLAGGLGVSGTVEGLTEGFRGSATRSGSGSSCRWLAR